MYAEALDTGVVELYFLVECPAVSFFLSAVFDVSRS